MSADVVSVRHPPEDAVDEFILSTQVSPLFAAVHEHLLCHNFALIDLLVPGLTQRAGQSRTASSGQILSFPRNK